MRHRIIEPPKPATLPPASLPSTIVKPPPPSAPGRDSPATLKAVVTDPRVPKVYRRLAIKRAKLAADDFNYRNYNSTAFSGIDFSHSNAYVCPLILALYHDTELRERVLAHLCLHEFCLACEFSFLSTMLTHARGNVPVSAGNLLRALRAMGDAASLGLLVGEEEGEMDLHSRITAFARFFLQHLLSDLSPGPRKISRRTETEVRSGQGDEGLRRLLSTPKPANSSSDWGNFASRVSLRSVCSVCEGVLLSEDTPLITTLAYPKTEEAVEFSAVVQGSLNLLAKETRFCEKCEKQVEARLCRRLVRPPDNLLLAVPSTSQTDREFLSRQQKWFPSSRSNPLSPGMEGKAKPCRYGAGCNRHDCRFAHTHHRHNVPEEPSPKYPPFLIHFSQRWLRTVMAEQASLWFPSSLSLLAGKEEVSVSWSELGPEGVAYDLHAAVFVIRELNPGVNEHLVAVVKTTPAPEEDNVRLKPWTVFNDLVVCGVTEEEALEWSAEWKIPALLLYRPKSRPNHHPLLDTVVNPISERVFWEDAESLAGSTLGTTFSPLTPEEGLPKAGDLVGIDAEFVIINEEEAEKRSDGTKATIKPPQMSLARVSVIRGSGPHKGQPFIDDYISNSEEVADYATKFSGIKPGDLDAAVTSKHLTTLKSSYLKLRWLIDHGVRFVGHGLANDFRVINIVVPTEQVIDTVKLFHQSQHRMVSLRFLTWHFLGRRIQAETHDSIEDARAALQLYQHYLTLQDKGADAVAAAVSELYETGNAVEWKVPE